jgi:hypothetical protein
VLYRRQMAKKKSMFSSSTVPASTRTQEPEQLAGTW